MGSEEMDEVQVLDEMVTMKEVEEKMDEVKDLEMMKEVEEKMEEVKDLEMMEEGGAGGGGGNDGGGEGVGRGGGGGGVGNEGEGTCTKSEKADKKLKNMYLKSGKVRKLLDRTKVYLYIVPCSVGTFSCVAMDFSSSGKEQVKRKPPSVLGCVFQLFLSTAAVQNKGPAWLGLLGFLRLGNFFLRTRTPYIDRVRERL